MNGKKWINIWLMTIIIVIATPLVILEQTNIPLRFSNSISYDAKLNFMRNNKLLDGTNTIVIGSSMALTNINGTRLEEGSEKIKKIANLSSWGLQTSEVLQLIKLIKLDKIEYIIYPTQYIDFKEYRVKDIDEDEVKSFLNNEFILSPYLNRLESLVSNIRDYMQYDNKYLNPNKYSYIGFDKTGGIELNFSSEYIDKKRWNSQKREEYTLEERCFNDLQELNNIAKSKDITLIVITTPYRKPILQDNKDVSYIFNKYVQKLEYISNKQQFIYLNMHEKLNLSDNYFLDRSHTNKKGAISVSNEILKSVF